MGKFFVVIVAMVVTFMLPVPTYALSEQQLNKFSQNNILFYNPDESNGIVCNGNNSGGNVNYAGAQVWEDVELQRIAANREVYEEAASEYGFPWQVMATLHSLETSLRLYNPDNGQGVYQLYSYTAGGTNENRFEPAESISEEEFRRQTLIAAEVVSGMVGDLNNPDDVKKLFFMYNGTADVYKEKAIAMGFSEEQAENGEGSVYVMNRYDEQRDPADPEHMSDLWPGRFVADGVYDSTATTMVFGGFVKYEALQGLYCNSGMLVSGGFKTVGEADEAVMSYYKTKLYEYKDIEPDGGNTIIDLDGAKLKAICAGGPLNNCVAFTQWFIAKYTTAGNIGLPNGKDVVGTLAGGSYGFGDIQSEPRPYAIFSRQSGGDGAGHTGVVLGVNEENDEIIIGESGCGANLDWTGAHKYSLSEYRADDYTYVYTDGILVGL